MRSRPEARRGVVLVAALLFVAPCHGAARSQESAVQTNADGPGVDEIARAIERVKADPNLATERTIKTLQWNTPRDRKPFSLPAWFEWIGELFRWIEQSARLLVWSAAGLLAVFLAVYLTRVARARRGLPGEASFAAPTHVRELDIRPESLPQHIGAAARALWERGEHRAALALLYRGMLSRLAHVHRVPIRDSSTEGDCLVLAANHLAAGPREYASRLVRVWQRAVYGREHVETDLVHALCDEFSSALDSAAPLTSFAREGAR